MYEVTLVHFPPLSSQLMFVIFMSDSKPFLNKCNQVFDLHYILLFQCNLSFRLKA